MSVVELQTRASGVAVPLATAVAAIEVAVPVRPVVDLDAAQTAVVALASGEITPLSLTEATTVDLGDDALKGSKGGKGDKGDRGPAAWLPVQDWLPDQDYVVGPPASVVVHENAVYVCQHDHESAVLFDETRWQKIVEGSTAQIQAHVDGVSSLLETIQSNLAYDVGQMSATVQDIHTAVVDVRDDLASGTGVLQAQIDTLGVTVGNNTSAITTEQYARADADTALAGQISSLTSTVNANTAAISSEAVTRANADTAFAGSLSTLSTTVGGHTSSISTLSTSVDGIRAASTTVVTNDGVATGWATIGGTPIGSYAAFAVNNFAIVDPAHPTSLAQPFMVVNESGSWVVRMNATLFAENIITSSATDPTNTFYFDFANGKFGRVDDKFFVDAKNGRIFMSSS